MRPMLCIKTIRRRLGLTQTEFGSLAGVHQSTISKWERGDGEPSATELRRIINGSGGKVGLPDFFEPAEQDAAA